MDDIETIERVFKNICVKYLFQTEKGEQGTCHLQGAIWLKNKMRFTQFKLMKEIHWEAMRNEEASLAYCQKDETYDGVYRAKWGFPAEIKIIKDLYDWQNEIKDLYFTEPDGQKVYWRWEDVGGVGKSAFCKYMYVKYGVVTIQGGKFSDIMNIVFNLDMDKVKMIIIDVPRKLRNEVSYEAIECILNGMITNTKYETGIKVFNPPHVVVLANYEPANLDDLSERRWDVKKIITKLDLAASNP